MRALIPTVWRLTSRLLLLACAAAACRPVSARSELVLEPDLDRAGAGADLDALARRALPALRARVEELDLAGGAVALRGGRLVVELPRASAEELARLERDLTRRARLELKLLGPRTGDPERRAAILVERVAELALTRIEAPKRARVAVRFTAAAREQLAWVSATNLGSLLALTVDGELAAAAAITRPLRGGEWIARPAGPQSELTPGVTQPQLSYRELIALERRLRAALVVPLRRRR